MDARERGSPRRHRPGVISKMDPDSQMIMQIIVVAEVRDTKAQAVAEQMLETTARDIQLKLMMLADALASVGISVQVGRRAKRTKTLTGDSLPQFLLKE